MFDKLQSVEAKYDQLMAEMADPARFKRMLSQAAAQAAHRVAIYEQLAGIKVDPALHPIEAEPEKEEES